LGWSEFAKLKIQTQSLGADGSVTGYNHYPSCTCGWCVNYGRTGTTLAHIRDDLPRRDAEAFLKRNSVNSVSGCYLVPNARCPVCSGPVFFYANRFGSRVYFDDVGPPWPKHPCTDNPRVRFAADETPVPIVKRPRGRVMEIVENARFLGRLSGASQWKLMQVEDIHIEDGRTTLRLKSVELDAETLWVFWLETVTCGIVKADIVSVGKTELSYFDLTAFSPKTIQYDGAFKRSGEEKLDHNEFVRSALASWRQRGITSPDRVAGLLNKCKIKTADGLDWNARLVLTFLQVRLESCNRTEKRVMQNGPPKKKKRRRISLRVKHPPQVVRK
jgi:hypothetical protein